MYGDSLEIAVIGCSSAYNKVDFICGTFYELCLFFQTIAKFFMFSCLVDVSKNIPSCENAITFDFLILLFFPFVSSLQ